MLLLRLPATCRFISARRVWPRASAVEVICSSCWCCWRCWGRNSAVVMNIGQVRQASLNLNSLWGRAADGTSAAEGSQLVADGMGLLVTGALQLQGEPPPASRDRLDCIAGDRADADDRRRLQELQFGAQVGTDPMGDGRVADRSVL